MDLLEEIITPKRAAELLTLNTNNRPLNRKHVLFLAQQMLEGNWMQAGDPIRISENGRLLDGQHRLTAIVESDTPVKMLVIMDLADETFQVMDTGRNRTAADMVSLSGQPNATTVAALVKMIIQYRHTSAIQEARRGRGKTGITNQQVVEFLATGQDIQPFVKQGMAWFSQCRLLSGTEYAFLYWLFDPIDKALAFEFLSSLVTALNLSAESPIYLLRRKLENYKINGIPLTGKERLALILKAWNLVRTGKTVSLLNYNPARESFPVPV